MTPKFSVNEIAIYIGDGKADDGRPSALKYGDEVTILHVFPVGDRVSVGRSIYFSDEPFYLISGNTYIVESRLRKRRPPEKYKDQFTPATKPLDQIIADCNKRSFSPQEIANYFHVPMGHSNGRGTA